MVKINSLAVIIINIYQSEVIVIDFVIEPYPGSRCRIYLIVSDIFLVLFPAFVFRLHPTRPVQVLCRGPQSSIPRREANHQGITTGEHLLSTGSC